MQYRIEGEPMPVLICELEENESVVCEAGAMSWMSPNMQMETVGGGASKVFGRMFSGESMFQNRYTAKGRKGMIAFSAGLPGSIRAFEIGRGRSIIAQKHAFLASTEGVELSVHMQKKFSTGLFGGEGFIMQKISGEGTVFLEIDGFCVEYVLAEGQKLLVDTAHLAMMDATATMSIEQVKGIKNALFGGESLFNTVITGPGRVMLQTMPLSNLATIIGTMLPNKS